MKRGPDQEGRTRRAIRSKARLGTTLALATLLLALLLPARAEQRQTVAIGSPFAGDTVHECLEPVPEAVGIQDVTDNGQTVRLDSLVLLDGISRSRAVKVLSTTSKSYAPLAITLKNTFRRVRFNNSGEYHEMEQAALDAVGGERPRGFDLVYVMTSKDLHSMGEYGVAGFAFCIGGVRYPKVAFAIGEGLSPWEATLSDKTFSGKIAGHEMGHLLGAHHHYGNCAEGDRSTEGGGEPSICTLMWPTHVRYSAVNFGTLEGTVVRGHAVDFASP